MGIYNILDADVECPVCGQSAEANIQFRLGWLDLNQYQLGDRLVWCRGGIHEPKTRPPDGNLEGEGVAECSNCHAEYWVIVRVVADTIESVGVDQLREE